MISPLVMIFLETERLLFRSHEPQDEPAFIAMHTDPEVRRYVGGQPWPLEKTQTRFRNEYLGKPDDTYGLWATILKEEGNYIGSCGLRAGDHPTEAHLGFYLAQPYWRRGFASEASNAASEHILQKFGFKYSSQEVIPATGRILHFYELTKSDSEKKPI